MTVMLLRLQNKDPELIVDATAQLHQLLAAEQFKGEILSLLCVI